MTKAFTIIATLLTLFITAPIWYYLLYKVLEACHATELMWFLFWIYVPLAFFCQVVWKLAQPKAA